MVPVASMSAPESMSGEDLEDIVGAHESVEVRRFVMAGEHHGCRIDKVLVDLVPELSRNYLQQLLASGLVQINGRTLTKAAHKAKVLDQLVVTIEPTQQSQAFKPESLPIAVEYEDDHLMVINKSAGMVVHPAPGNWSGTLLNGLLARNAGAQYVPRAGIVHRLDKDTSGLMVVAKDRATMDALVKMIAARQVSRQYLALAHKGWSRSGTQTVREPIGRDPRQRLRMAVVDLALHPGKEARTDVVCLDSVADYCWVQCTLHTGRTHQIRVHLAWLGHPLVADTLYGGKVVPTLQRQALHAYRLAFEHPITQQPMQFQAPLPSDIGQTVQQLQLSYNFP